MRRFKFRHKETIATIIVDEADYYDVAVKSILEARNEIERFCILNPDFLTSYEPMDCEGNVVGKMCWASKVAGVGPMAAVAGTIAEYAVRRMVEAGAKLAIVDNGGDIAIHSDREVIVGLYPSEFAFRLDPVEFYAVCTSSGKIGRSVSFGYADAATVFARDASIADALATALGNEVKKEFGKEELKGLVEGFLERYGEYADGFLVLKDNIIAFAGNVPEIVKAKINPDLITKG